MKFKRYIIEFVGVSLPYYHCTGLPANPADINSALLMNKSALTKAIAKNCHTLIGKPGGGVTRVDLPYRIIEVECECML